MPVTTPPMGFIIIETIGGQGAEFKKRRAGICNGLTLSRANFCLVPVPPNRMASPHAALPILRLKLC